MRLSINFIDILIPKELRQNRDLLFKLRLFVLILMVCFISVTIPLIISLTGIKEFHPFLGIEYSYILIPFLILWVKKSFSLAVNIHFTGVLIGCFIPITHTGGISSPIAIWVCLVPIFALFYIGFESALFWMVSLIFLVLIIYQIDNLGLINQISQIEYQNIDYAYNLVAFLVFLTLGIYIFWSAQKRLTEEVQKQTQALEEQNSLLERKTYELNMARQALINSNETLALQNDRISKAKEDLVQSNLLLEKQNHTLITTKSALIDSNAALNRYAHTVSHDLKEPLRSISSFSELLYQHYGKQGLIDSTREDFFKFVLDGTKNMDRLIKEMLHFSALSEKGESHFKNVDLNQVVQIAQHNLSKQIEDAGVEIQVEKLPEIFGLFIPLTQIFQNLISNAIKFRKEEIEPHIKIYTEEQVGKWIISVEDNGIGIAPENHKKIFQEFEKLHDANNFKGQGIGLSSCKKFVQKHGGRISVKSTPNEGTTFSFIIPKKKEESMVKPGPVKQQYKMLID